MPVSRAQSEPSLLTRKLSHLPMGICAQVGASLPPHTINKHRKLPLAELLRIKANGLLEEQKLDARNLEWHLELPELIAVFGMDVEAIRALPKWRKVKLKKDAGLF